MIDNWTHSPFHTRSLRPSSSYSSGSSAQSSHLSILTTTSSLSSGLSSTSTSSEHADQPSPLSSEEQTSSNGSKTHAFFASPFASTPPLPSVPFSAPATVPSSSSTSDAEVTPRMEFAPAPTSKRSMNDAFFSPSWPAGPALPLPEADGRAFSSRAGTLPPPPASAPPSITRLPPLSRLFPSRVRYTTIDALPSREGSPQGLPSHLVPPAPRPSVGRRQLVDLDGMDYQTYQDLSSPEPVYPTPPAHVHSPKALNVSIPAAPPSSGGSSSSGPLSFPTPVAVTKSQQRQMVASPLSMTPPVALPAPKLRPGDVVAEPLSSSDSEFGIEFKPTLQLVLIRTLGQGAFSSVWLAKDESGEVGKLEVVRRSSLKRQKSKHGSLKRSGTGSIRRRAKRTSEDSDDGHSGSERIVDGTVPKISLPSESPSDGHLNVRPSTPGIDTGGGNAGHAGRLVALKMTDKSMCDRDDRTRVSFIREVEVLKHISHPSIVSYIHAFSTASHHVLVLEHISGGELFDLVSSQQTHSRLDEPLLRRIFGELCRAVSWMHAVGLVHRDIKLENILLTRDAFADPNSPNPLVKLTDFGLSRFIDPASPLLTTRCGSESYAAPELVTGRPYDGRDTDAWSCGIVLYALVTRRLPFDAMNPTPDNALTPGDHDDPAGGKKVKGPRRDEKSERRALLMRIAKGEYSWPELPPMSPRADGSSGSLWGLDLARSEGVRRIVGRLLVRDPRKRAKVAQLWEDAWLLDEGAPPAPLLPDNCPDGNLTGSAPEPSDAPITTSVTQAWDAVSDGSDEFWDDTFDDDEGVLVEDQDIGPGSVARQELMP